MSHLNFIMTFISIRISEPKEKYSSYFYEEDDAMDSAAFDQRHRHRRSHSPVNSHSNRKNRFSRGRSYSPPNTNLHYQGYDSHSSHVVCLGTYHENPVNQSTLVSGSVSKI